jgi:hypothetical protein
MDDWNVSGIPGLCVSSTKVPPEGQLKIQPKRE